ncbi:TXNL1 [Symbiodinium natans]|uniref:TXNL1 protein n=1 Tax=Symbiodinium natans TaxID=878477 RepID=A0A812PPW6_9DINO|nr:TXNL1 [Symbiodinium natans]
MASLDEFVEKGQLECLNEDKANPVLNVLDPSPDTALSSDENVDHQLLLKVQFRVPVKLQSVRILGSSEDGTAPQTVKLFLDKVNMGFDDADEEPVQELQLGPENVDGGEVCQLRFVKFQNVSSLQIFFQENFGAPVTRIFWGMGEDERHKRLQQSFEQSTCRRGILRDLNFSKRQVSALTHNSPLLSG